MMLFMKKILQINFRSVFLIDAVGAFLSFLLSGFILPYFSSIFGIDPIVFKSLAGIALSFIIYDLIIYFKFQQIRQWMIQAIIILNLSYCVITAALIFLLPNVSILGQRLLLGESFVIILIVWFEYQILQRLKIEGRR